LSENVPGAHALQTVSALALHAACCWVPAGQIVHGTHWPPGER
jgi:hypothetical protein